MTHMDEMRASDADRERVVSALQEQVGEGRLTLEEFEERSDLAYSAKTIGELRKLTHDLPVELFPEQMSPFGPQGPWAAPYHQMPPYHQIPPQQMAQMRRINPLVLLPVMFLALTLLGGSALFWGAGAALPVFFLIFLIVRVSAGGGHRHG